MTTRRADYNTRTRTARSVYDLPERLRKSRIIPTAKVVGNYTGDVYARKAKKKLPLKIERPATKKPTLASVMPEQKSAPPKNRTRPKVSSKWKITVKKIKPRRTAKQTRVARKQTRKSSVKRWRKQMLRNLIDNGSD